MVGAATAYVHLSSVPALLTLPTYSGTEARLPTATDDGIWNAGPGSVVGWRVEQVFIGEQLPLVARSGKVGDRSPSAEGRSRRVSSQQTWRP